MKLTKSKSIAGCTPPPTPSPTPFPTCDAGTERLEVNLTTDNYASETSWELVNTVTSQVEITQSSFVNNKQYVNNWCMQEAEYRFTINDTFGDGICCGYGNGSYIVKWGGNTVGSGGAFGTSASHTFGSISPPSPTNPPTAKVSSYQINDLTLFSYHTSTSTYTLTHPLHHFSIHLQPTNAPTPQTTSSVSFFFFVLYTSISHCISYHVLTSVIVLCFLSHLIAHHYVRSALAACPWRLSQQWNERGMLQESVII